MIYVLDTDVLSLTSPLSNPEGSAVATWRRWVREHAGELRLSAVTLMELRFGLAKLQARGAVAKAQRLQRWLTLVQTVYRPHVLPVTDAVAVEAGAMLWRAVAAGMRPSAEDALIAATATVGGFTLLSRNLKHMEALGAPCRDPLAVPLG